MHLRILHHDEGHADETHAALGDHGALANVLDKAGIGSTAQHKAPTRKSAHPSDPPPMVHFGPDSAAEGHELMATHFDLVHKPQALLAVKDNGWALEFCTKQLQNDEDVVLAAVGSEGHALGFASHEMQGHRAVVRRAVNQDGTSLEFAPAFQQDRRIVLAAVTQNGKALRHAHKSLQEDPEVSWKRRWGVRRARIWVLAVIARRRSAG